jgi:hypothetical protein
MMDKLDVVIGNYKVRWRDACRQGMTNIAPEVIDGQRYTMAIQVDEDLEIPDWYEIINLTSKEKMKWVCCTIDFSQYGVKFKKKLEKLAVNLYPEEAKRHVDDFLSFIYKIRAKQLKKARKKKKKKLKLMNLFTPLLQEEVSPDHMKQVLDGVDFNSNFLLSRYESRILFSSLIQTIRKAKVDNNESFKMCLNQKVHYDLNNKLVTKIPTEPVEERSDVVTKCDEALFSQMIESGPFSKDSGMFLSFNLNYPLDCENLKSS